MTVAYEWDVEEITAVESTDHEAGEVIDHRHVLSYTEALSLHTTMMDKPSPGMTYRIVLVRDDNDRRAWAYMESGELPRYFTDADGNDYAKVPERFHNEVSRSGGA